MPCPLSFFHYCHFTSLCCILEGNRANNHNAWLAFTAVKLFSYNFSQSENLLSYLSILVDLYITLWIHKACELLLIVCLIIFYCGYFYIYIGFHLLIWNGKYTLCPICTSYLTEITKYVVTSLQHTAFTSSPHICKTISFFSVFLKITSDTCLNLVT